MARPNADNQQTAAPPDQRPAADWLANVTEWGLAGLSAVLVGAMIGFLLHQAIVSESRPPDLAVVIEGVDSSAAGWRASFRVTNTGDEAAATVRIIGSLMDGVAIVETSEASLDYVPARSERRGALLFSHDPRQHDFTVRPAGYAVP